MRFLKSIIPATALLVMLTLAACQSVQPTPQETPVVLPTATTAPQQPTPTPTPALPSTLVMCVQEEPQTLYVYGGSSRSMWSVLEAIYDGPVDTRNFELVPVILEKIPSLIDGDAVTNPVAVKDGDPVIDADGNLVSLTPGVRVIPSGCASSSCALAWDGTSELLLNQLSVKFKLLSGLKWSDGQPLTAADSVFSYNVAADPNTPVSKTLIDRTYSYKALDDQTAEWIGIPGYYEQRFGAFFFLPLPEHILGNYSAKDLLNQPAAARSPLGWGPYVIQDWIEGDHITLSKNENYFRAAEGLPKFDTLVFRFIGATADGNMNTVLAGECDVVDQNGEFLQMVPGLLERENQGKLRTYVGQGPEWEHLDFGIRPASYDDTYDPSAGDRPDLFGDYRTRQAFAYCIDRDSINASLLYNRSVVQNSYLMPSHPQYLPDLQAYPYNPTEAMRLLEEVGWKDTDGDAATPRVAVGVAGVPDGTALNATYLVSEASLRQQVAQSAAASLRSCGIGVQVKSTNAGELYGPGPDGLVFGRKFDLVQFSWADSSWTNCQLYTSAKIPASANLWIGTNVSGYANPEFDEACAATAWAHPGDANAADLNRRVQEIFARDLPVIPLYAQVKIAIARPDLCGLVMDTTSRSIFWNLESFNLSGVCQ